jgi:hypothetical protein
MNNQRLKAQGARERGDLFPTLSRIAKTPRGLSEKGLCALCLLFVHPLVLLRAGSRERKILNP